MNCTSSPTSQSKRQAICCALLIFPAIALGVLAMIWSGVSPALWGQQLAAWAALSLLAHPLRRTFWRIPETVWMILLLILLASSLLGAEIEGARRWLDMGFLNINVSMLILPALLTVLDHARYPHPLILSAAIVLCFQPDLSQLTAMSLAVLPLLWQNKEKRLWTTGILVAFGLLVFICMGTSVTLEPVPYCEGILALLSAKSPILYAAGCAALAAIPAGLLYRYFRQGKTGLLSIAIYYAVSMLFILSGDYPVPFMGFGLSPIAGYYLAYISAPEHAGVSPAQPG